MPSTIPYWRSLRSAQDPLCFYLHRKEAFTRGTEMVPCAGTWESGLWDMAWSTSLDFSRKTQQVNRNGKEGEEIPQQLQWILKHNQKSSFAVFCQACILFCVCQDPAKHKWYRLLQNFSLSVQTLLGDVHRNQTEKHCAYFGQEPSYFAMKCCSINKYISANKCIKTIVWWSGEARLPFHPEMRGHQIRLISRQTVGCWVFLFPLYFLLSFSCTERTYKRPE